jgi:signal transduction histidine kinase
MADTSRSSPAEMLAAIERAHALYIRDADRGPLFEQMLVDVLSLTRCEYGFIGEVLHDAEGAPYLKTWALTDIAWDSATKELYEASLGQDGGLIFANLHTLFGHALTTGEVVISNEPAVDQRRGGLPPGHPPLLSFLGIPLFRNDEMIGMVGIANRSDGFLESDVRELEPYLALCAHLIDVIRTDRERALSQDAEREALAAAARQERLSHIGRLASSVAHDLNSLINVISLQCELLEMDDSLPPSASQGIARIQEMCDRAAQMTSRLQRLRRPLSDPEERCAIASTVSTSAGFLRTMAGEGVDVSVRIDLDADVEVTMSEGEMLQVLLNLVSNASEALGGRGHIDIDVHLDPRDEAGGVAIEVADDGPGVPDSVIEQVFTPFASTKGEGRGLGLAIVHSLLETNGGSIEMAPTKSGALFRLVIPRVAIDPV